MKPKEILALSEEKLFQKLKENVERNVLVKYNPITEEVKRRIEFELAEVKESKFSKNILILEDLVEYADKTNIPVSYGRGGTSSSIVNYILGITKLDPIEWGFLSEQFFDFETGKIPELILDFGKHSLIKKYIHKHYKKQIELEKARILKERKSIKVGFYFDPNIGLLNLRELDILQSAVKIISRKQGKHFNIRKISLEDKKTFALLQDGKVENIFQFESRRIREFLRRLNPDTFTHLYTLQALYRPGPIDSGMVNQYIFNRLEFSEIRKIHPVFDKHTKETYGIVVFQE